MSNKDKKLSDFEALVLNGDRLWELGDYDKACDDYLAASKLQPDDPYIWESCARGLFMLGKIKQTVECGERALKQYPCLMTEITMIEIFKHIGRHDRAQEIYDSSVKRLSGNKDVLDDFLAKSFDENGKYIEPKPCAKIDKKPEPICLSESDWQTVLYDCDCHTNYCVVVQLMKATGCTKAVASHLSDASDQFHELPICRGTKKKCEHVADVLGEIGLKVEVTKYSNQ